MAIRTSRKNQDDIIHHEDKVPDLLRRRLRERQVSATEIAATLGLAKATVYRGVHQHAPEALVQLIGRSVGYTAIALAGLHHRDAVDHKVADGELSSKTMADAKAASGELDAFLSWENPNRARGSCRRLAFASLRSTAKVSLAKLAKLHIERIGQPERLAETQRKMMDFEQDVPHAATDDEVNSWLETLAQHNPKIQKDLLRERGELLQQVHFIRDTMTWEMVKDSKIASMQIFGPHAAGQSMRWGRSLTAFGAMRIEMIDVRQSAAVKRGALRLLNAKHESFQIGVVLRGRLRLTVALTEFPSEVTGSRPRLKHDGVLEDRLCEQGEIVAFQSRLWHRVEFLGKHTVVLMIIIDGNLGLGRRMGPRRPGSPGTTGRAEQHDRRPDASRA